MLPASLKSVYHARAASADAVVVVVGCGQVLAAVYLAMRIVDTVPQLNVAARTAAGAAVFGLLVLLLWSFGRPKRELLHLPLEAVKTFTAALVGTGIVTAVFARPAISDPAGLVAEVFFPAAVEEVVFRGFLFYNLRQSLAKSRPAETATLIAACAAALTFALAHAPSIAGLASSAGAVEVGRLVAMGLLYTVLATAGGLWLAVAAHAAMNTRLMVADAATLGKPSLGVAIAAICVACLILRATDGYRARTLHGR
jgi:membrane protease YdiL (CAAX protease family)